VRVDFDLHRQAELQRVLRQLGRIERDAHRYALHHLDPVAGRVLRRQQGEGAAGAGAESGHPPVEFDCAAVDVSEQFHCLPGAQIEQLPLLEIRIHPYLVERNHGHKRRARADTLSDLHAAPGDDAGNGGRQGGARIGQIGFAHPRRGALHVRMGFHGGAVHERPLRGELLPGRLQ
jgi:hypothetical protein